MPRAMDGIWRVGTECLNAPALCLSMAVCACRCLCRLCLQLSVYVCLWPSFCFCGCLGLCLSAVVFLCLSFCSPTTSRPPSLPFSCLPAPSLARRHTATLPCLLFTCTSLCACVCARARACRVRACVRACVARGLSAQDVVMQQTFFNILLLYSP